MVIDLIVLIAVVSCAALLVSGRTLNIHVTHTHKVEEQKTPDPLEKDEEPLNNDTKELPELLQGLLGVLDEE